MAKLTKWGKRSRRDARANEKRLATDRVQREQRRQRAAEAGAKAPRDAQGGRSAPGR